MPRFVVVDNGVVVGILQADIPPTINIPRGRLFVHATDIPDVRGGETYDPATGIFSQPVVLTEARLVKLEADVETLKKQKV